jgi:hypothetical protein
MDQHSHKKYKVIVADNFHYMDESEHYTHGEFDQYEEALIASKKIVDDFLVKEHKPEMTADVLYEHYASFGDDPFIVGQDETGDRFSAWNYAKGRCAEICK